MEALINKIFLMLGLMLLAVVVIGAIKVFVAAAAIRALKSKIGGTSKAIGPIKQRVPLTKNEQPMYFRLTEALPKHLVLAQVAFSALIETKDRATRNRFDKKVADFVVCNRAFEVLAVIELDDSTHRGREKQDEARSALLTNAGYKVVRYRHVPDIATVQNDVLPPVPIDALPQRKASAAS